MPSFAQRVFFFFFGRKNNNSDRFFALPPTPKPNNLRSRYVKYRARVSALALDPAVQGIVYCAIFMLMPLGHAFLPLLVKESVYLLWVVKEVLQIAAPGDRPVFFFCFVFFFLRNRFSSLLNVFAIRRRSQQREPPRRTARHPTDPHHPPPPPPLNGTRSQGWWRC